MVFFHSDVNVCQRAKPPKIMGSIGKQTCSFLSEIRRKWRSRAEASLLLDTWLHLVLGFKMVDLTVLLLWSPPFSCRFKKIPKPLSILPLFPFSKKLNIHPISQITSPFLHHFNPKPLGKSSPAPQPPSPRVPRGTVVLHLPQLRGCSLEGLTLLGSELRHHLSDLQCGTVDRGVGWFRGELFSIKMLGYWGFHGIEHDFYGGFANETEISAIKSDFHR